MPLNAPSIFMTLNDPLGGHSGSFRVQGHAGSFLESHSGSVRVTACRFGLPVRVSGTNFVLARVRG